MNIELDIWPRIESGLRGAVPLALTVMLVVLGAMPLGVPALGPIMPLFPLMAIFYWVIHRPDRFPYLGTFVIGLFQDVLAGTPMGMSALVLVAVHAAVASQRKFFHGKSFMVLWSGFAVLASGAAALNWVLAMAFYASLASPTPALFQLLLTVALFPCLTWFFRLVRRDLLRPT